MIETVRLRAGNGWRATVEDLPVYDQGRRISYAWTEREVPDYRLTGTVTAVTQDDTRTTLTNSREYTLTIRYEYADGGEAAPSVEEKHLAGEAYDVASPEIEGYTASLIRVQGTEESAEGYTSESSVNGTETVFTNTHIPATVDLTVSKVWDDNNDQDGIRPAKLLVTLSGGRSVTLNAGNGWLHLQS